MIDLHCHILPEIDDGARDMDDAIAMARQAEADGIEVVCATPHIRHDHDVRIHELNARIVELQATLDGADVAVQIARGGEVAQPIVASLADEELVMVALAGGSWVLLEPPAGPLGQRLIDTIETLNERGFEALVAHPERHVGGGFEEVLREVVSAGALVQGTAAAVRAHDGTLSRLAREGLLHVIASDAHSAAAGRRLELSAAYEQLAAAGADTDAMRDTARAIVTSTLP